MNTTANPFKEAFDASKTDDVDRKPHGQGVYNIKINSAFYNYSDKWGGQLTIDYVVTEGEEEGTGHYVNFKFDTDNKIGEIYKQLLLPTKWYGMEGATGSAESIIKEKIDSLSQHLEGRDAILTIDPPKEFKGNIWLKKTIAFREDQVGE